MQSTQIAIIGGGLSGLYAAFLLEQNGITDYRVFEARDLPGGRINSISIEQRNTSNIEHVEKNTNRFDLGPTWYWPSLQTQLHRAIQDLGLQTFDQFETGDMIVERSSHTPPSRIPGYVNAPTSTRLIGGMSALIDALCKKTNASRILTNHAVRHISICNQDIQLDCEDSAGQIINWKTQHIFLALPPRLVEHTIKFTPALPDSLNRAWRDTPTWMAPHAKYIAIYEKPFWRDIGLSGAARSAHGPLVEIHDASMPDGNAALFGFFGVPAQVRKDVSEDLLRTHCRAQFARLFGPQASVPLIDFIKDWSQDLYTATSADMNNPGHHTQAPVATLQAGPWRDRVTGIASEWSPQFPGYLAGAIEAATFGIEKLLKDFIKEEPIFDHFTPVRSE